MRSRLLLLATAGAVLLAVVGAVVALQPAPAATRAEQAARIAAELRCPDCQALSVAESRTASAAAIRAEIDAQLAAGRSPEEVRQHFVDRYGEWILLAPANPLAWWLPVAALLAGAAVFVLWLRRNGAAAAEAPSALDDAERARVREELEALDG